MNVSLSSQLVQARADLAKVSWVPLPLILGFTVAFNLGLGSLTWVVATEVLPVNSRGWTHTLANLTSNLCWFLVTKTFRDLQVVAVKKLKWKSFTIVDVQDSLGHAAPFYFYGGVSLAGGLFIFIFLPETRGKTPEETAAAFQQLRKLSQRRGKTSGGPETPERL